MLHDVRTDGAVDRFLHRAEASGAHHDLLHAVAGGVVHDGRTAVQAALSHPRDLALALELLPLLLAGLKDVKAILKEKSSVSQRRNLTFVFFYQGWSLTLDPSSPFFAVVVAPSQCLISSVNFGKEVLKRKFPTTKL